MLKSLFPRKLISVLLLLLLLQINYSQSSQIDLQQIKTQRIIQLIADNFQSKKQVSQTNQRMPSSDFDKKNENLKNNLIPDIEKNSESLSQQQNYRIQGKIQLQQNKQKKDNDEKLLLNVRLLQMCYVNGCKSCDEDYNDVCEQCADQYVLDKGKCFIPDQYPLNCQDASKTGNPSRFRCTQCYQGYALDSTYGTCSQCWVENCLLCSIDSLDKCEQCTNGYFVKQSGTQCLQCRDNCRSCSSENNCFQCNDGYFLNDGQQCVQCKIQGCQVCQYSSQVQVCTSCSGAYVLFENRCFSMTKSQGGVVVYDGFSLKCPLGCYNCEILGYNFVCYVCDQGYRLDRGFQQCFKCSSLCKQCYAQDSTKCKECFPGYVLNGSECLKCTGKYCKSCSPYNTSSCYECADHYDFNQQGICQPCNNGCKRCHFDGNCTLCSYGYHLYGYENGTFVCQSCMQGCGDCEYWSGPCKQCFPRYYLKQDKTCAQCQQGCWKCSSATACIQCADGKILMDKKCLDAVQNCQVLLSTGKCSKCLIGYKLEQSTNKCIYSYQSSLVGSNRLSCPNGLYLWYFDCLQCKVQISNCLSCKESYCQECAAGYYLSNSRKKCNKCSINNCKQCANSEVCQVCQNGYFLLSDVMKAFSTTEKDSLNYYGLCLPCSSNCLTCEYRKDICLTCNSGYYLTENRKCLTQNSFDFAIKIDTDFSTFASEIDSLKTQFANLLSEGDNLSLEQKKKFVQITKISQGSVNVEGFVSASSPQNLKKTFNNFDSLSSGSQLGSKFPIISSKLSNYQQNTQQTVVPQDNNSNSSTNTSPENSSNIGPIIGGVVGGCVAVIVIIVLIVYICCCKKKRQQMRQASEDKKSSSTGDENESKKKQQDDENKGKQEQQDSQKYFNNPPASGQNQKQNWVNPQYYL